MSAHRPLAILFLAPALAFAAGPATPADKAAAEKATEKTAEKPAPAEKPSPAEKPAATEEEIRREVDQKVEAAKKELREEIRAQAATQSAAQGWQEEWSDEKRKLELLTMDGYFRVRPDLFHNFDLRRVADPSGFTVFASSPASASEHTMAGVNMRLRVEPTVNVSEEVRLRMQIDGLDNVIMGSTPDYAATRSEFANPSILSESQAPANLTNALKESINLKRVFGEITTPVGVLRFGRMGSQWGLGMVHSDGSCFDCDYGDTVDRIQFVTQPLPGIYVTPMIDFNSEGPSSMVAGETGGQPVDLSQSDDAHSYVLAVAKRDTDQQVKAKLENGQTVLNGGLHLTYRTQHSDVATDASGSLLYTVRNSWLVIPDLWGKYEQRNLRVEVEFAARIGGIGNAGNLHGLPPEVVTPLSIIEFGAVAQGEYRLLNDKLKLRAEAGWASGDRAPGMGARPNRAGFPQPGDLDGPQWACSAGGGCTDPNIRNFTFNRDYRVDLILWRELLGAITDAIYVKPSVEYELADGLHLQGGLIYSRAVFPNSVPTATDPNNLADIDSSLGVEFDGGVQYETDDGFFAQVQAGILFPLGGFNNPSIAGQAPVSLESATAFRAAVGVRF